MMARASSAWLVVACVSACHGREITVFEVPAKVAGAGGGGNAGSAGSAGTAGSSVDVGGMGGFVEPPEAGSAGAAPGGSAGQSGGGTSEGGGGTPPGDKTCRTSEDCGPGWRCEKLGCDAVFGECEPRSVFDCPPEPAAVCGCNGVTYWNECVRRHFDVTQDYAEECRSTARACDVGSDCEAPFATCSHLLPPGELCGHGAGTCWVLPPSCLSVPPGAKKWRQCFGPDMPLGPCVDTCFAIESERTHIAALAGDPCK